MAVPIGHFRAAAAKVADQVFAPWRQPPVAKRSAFQPIGAPGFSGVGGYISTPEDIGVSGSYHDWVRYRIYSEQVPIIAAAMRAYQNFLERAPWRVVAAGDDGASQNAAAWLSNAIEDAEQSLLEIIRWLAMARFLGFAISEWTAIRRADGTFGITNVAPRPQPTIERWDVDDHGNLRGVYQRAPSNGREVYLPRGKIIYLADAGRSDRPDGQGLLRDIANTAETFIRCARYHGIGIATDLAGVPMIGAPLSELTAAVNRGDISQADADRILSPFKQFARNHQRNVENALIYDSEVYRDLSDREAPSAQPKFKIDFMRGAGTAHRDVLDALRDAEARIARVLSTEFLLLDGRGSGSYALSRDKTSAFAMVVDAWLRKVADAINRDLVAPLWRLNGFSEETRPWLEAGSAAVRDPVDVAAAMRDLAAAGGGLDPDDPAENVIRQQLGLPARDSLSAALDAAL